MLKKNKKQLVYGCYVLAVALFICIIFIGSQGKFENYKITQEQYNQSILEEETLQHKSDEIEKTKKAEEIALKKLKPIYESNTSANNDTLAVFGSMFDQIIKRAQSNKLLIRSIEYDMRPASDPIFANFADMYNVCELKFFFVGTYTQLQAYLADLNNNFPYLVYISNLGVTVFEEKPEYLLINMSITLYSKKPTPNKR